MEVIQDKSSINPLPRGEICSLVSQAFPLFSRRANWSYVEFWLKSESKFELSEIFYSGEGYAETIAAYRQLVLSARSETHTSPQFPTLLGKILDTETAIALGTNPLPSPHHHLDMNGGTATSFGVPVVQGGQVWGVLCFFGDAEALPFCLDRFSQYCNGLITSGHFGKTHQKVRFTTQGGLDAVKEQERSGRMFAIFEAIVKEGIFTPIHVYEDVDWWFNHLGIPDEYYSHFTNPEIAQHLQCFMAGKRLGQAMGDNEFLYVDKETKGVAQDGSPVRLKKFMLCPATFQDSVQVETKLEEFFGAKPDNYGILLKYLVSGGMSYPRGQRRLSIYIAEVSPFLSTEPSEEKARECDVAKVSSAAFQQNSSAATLAKYQEFLSRASLKLRPIYTVEPAADEVTPVRVILRHVDKSSFTQRFTEVLRVSKIPCRSKYIESFSNGAVVYTFSLQTTDLEKVNTFVKNVLLMTLVGGQSLRSLFLDGSFNCEEYSYLFAVKKFIYYFIQQGDDLKKLAEYFPRHTQQGQRLQSLQQRMLREAVTRSRILQCIMDHRGICKQLFSDFVQCAQVKPVLNDALQKTIEKACAGDDIDKAILLCFLQFNASLLKTNFWGTSKAALSFSLEPARIMSSSGYEKSPYCIFFVVSAEFQGFHIRVRDISRGGIRVIKSANHSAYEKNLAGQFSENYDLAYTQHMKNKDIPEFGSKGTVLLSEQYQSTAISFQKYISGLLDLLVIEPQDNIFDHYRKEEILFLGPDENTADLMEWAALYAKRRRYRYWKAFTTGKPASLGGIPHDTYGMTTRGVHRYVLSCLEKLGWKEEDVTKVQTGGPDGDLGSNEILLSKDKTIAIIDGSGVLYDRDGINRPALVALAKKRQMIKHFDPALLSPFGFKVLVEDVNVTLPGGELVESGLNFRNSFHLHPLFKADLFVPCGGRPQAIHINNVNQLFENGVPKFKVIVEGANLFFTQDARLELEKTGVILYKDSSANKGGVTSSSLEVLAALSLTDQEHEAHMQVKGGVVPEFYSRYVADIQARIESNALLEFNCIWDEHVRTGEPRCVLSDKISQKINDLNDACLKSNLYHSNPELRRKVLELCLPQSLTALAPLDVILSRLPENYSQALFNSYIASHYVYKFGLDTNEFGLFSFIDSILRQ